MIEGGDRAHSAHCGSASADDEVSEWTWPTGPGAELVLRKQRELVDLLRDRIPVFLDVNFWVAARQAMTGESDDPELVMLLGALRLGVGSGRMFCPVTADLIVEFSKQHPEQLAATMILVDLLRRPYTPPTLTDARQRSGSSSRAQEA